jgi:Na+-transporting NADH:ubiquinone oxidoreductase subunit A
MSKAIKINKGLDVRLYGQAKEEVKEIKEELYALKPLDYIGITPKLLVEVGDKVKIGQPIYYAKEKPKIMFTSPISGEVTEIQRGEKRVIQAIKIKSDNEYSFVDYKKESIAELSKEQIEEKMLQSGLWCLLRQRPYNVVPSPENKPKYIIVSGFDSSPLAPNYNILVKGEKAAMQVGIDVLKKITEKPIYLCVNKDLTTSDEILSLQDVEIKSFYGKHPCGNVSIQAEKINPINKGERIWFVNLVDVITIGNLFLEGRYNSEKIIALTGEEVKSPCYYKVRRGVSIKNLIKDNVNTEDHLRFISGNVLTGTRINEDGFLGAFDNQITVIKEGDYKEGLGWLKLGLKKFSFSHTFLSGFCINHRKRPFVIDSNIHGSKRAYVFTGEFEKVLPMDVYPMQLIKACITKDIDKMEELGIYEVDSEDFALCEVIDVSKTDIQDIIRSGLELMRKEMGE